MTGDTYGTRHVVVTQEHIDNGVKGSITSCPVALAIGMDVHVWGPDVCWSVNGNHASDRHREAMLPGPVAAWINDFDNDRPVEPFGFDIDWPAE